MRGCTSVMDLQRRFLLFSSDYDRKLISQKPQRWRSGLRVHCLKSQNSLSTLFVTITVKASLNKYNK